MKLRIAGIIAVVFLVGAISIYWWELREVPPHEVQPFVAREAPQGTPQHPLETPKVAPLPPPMVQPGMPKPAASKPVVALDSASPRSDLPAPSVPTGTKPLASPPPPSPPPSAPTEPPRPPEPDIVAKAAIELDQVGLMLRDYRTRMGENPVGQNADIMKAVMGENPKKARLGPPEGQQIDGNGELVDRWGTPYFFHQLARTDMEIRSAGPDRKMWTEDDIVGR